MAILVTGAAGFIGAHVADALLRAGETVIGVDDLNAYYDPQLKHDRLAALPGRHADFRFVAGDIAMPGLLSEALEGDTVDRMVHLAAQAGVRYSLEAPRAYLRSNLTGQLEVLELARGLGVRHLVYASSSSVYGDSGELPLSADARTDRPVSFYAATKKAGEAMAESYAHLYRIPMTGLRFFTVYGPWGRPDMAMWRFAERIARGEALPLYNGGKMRRDFTFIDDIVAGTIAALAHPPLDDGAAKPGGSTSPHALYNLGNDRPEALEHLVETIGAAFGVRPCVELLPMQAGDVTETWANIDPARRDLGYAPATPLSVGVPRFVDWYRRYTA